MEKLRPAKRKRLVNLERIPFLLPLMLIGAFVGGYFFVTSIGLDLRYLITILGFILSFYILLKTGKIKWFIISLFLFMFASNLFTSTGILMLSAGDLGTTYHESQQQIYCNQPEYYGVWIGGEIVTLGELESFTIEITALAEGYRHNPDGWSMVITYIENDQEQFYWIEYTDDDSDQIIFIETLYNIEDGNIVKIKVEVWSQTVASVYILPFHIKLSYVTSDPVQQNQAWGGIMSGDFSGVIGAILGAFSSFKNFFNFIIYVLPGMIIAIGIFYATIGRDPEGGTKTIFFGAMLYGGALVVNIMIAILGYNPFNYLNIGGINYTFGLSLDMTVTGNAGVDILGMVGNFFLMSIIGFIIAWLIIDGVRLANVIRKGIGKLFGRGGK